MLDFADREFCGHQTVQCIRELDAGCSVSEQDGVVAAVAHRPDAVVAVDDAPVRGEACVDEVQDLLRCEILVQLFSGRDDDVVRFDLDEVGHPPLFADITDSRFLFSRATIAVILTGSASEFGRWPRRRG